MNVLQVNCVYKKGSTGKMMYDIHSELYKYKIGSVICYGRGEKSNDNNVYKTCSEFYAKLNNLWSRITGIMYGGCHFSTHKLISIIKKVKPNIVHLQCINGNFVNIYKLISWLKVNHIKTVITLHAEFMYTGGCGHSLECEKWRNNTKCKHCPHVYQVTKSLFLNRTGTMWNKMKKAFDGFNDDLVVVSVSSWLMKRAISSPILSDKNHQVILNGIDTTVFYLRDKKTSLFIRRQLNMIGEQVVFYVTPSFNDDYNHIKGGYYIIELAKKMPEIKFLIAGPYKKGLFLPDNIVLLGKICDQHKLAEFYSMSDITVLTSKRETFSMVTVESLCCGTPVVGFKSGAPELIALNEYSEFVDYGDIDKLVQTLYKKMKNIVEKSGISDLAIKKYSKEKMCLEYVRIYQEVTK